MLNALSSLVVGAVTSSETQAETGGSPQMAAEPILDALPMPAFALDGEGTVIEWNKTAAAMFEIPREEIIGLSESEAAQLVTYEDDDEAKTLAGKVQENPRDADSLYDVERRDLPAGPVYIDQRALTNAGGNTAHLSFKVIPVFDDDGDLEAVVEIVQDQSEEIRRRDALHGLVSEVTETLEALADGQLDRRVNYDLDSTEHIDDELLHILDAVDETAERFEQVVQEMEVHASDLASFVDTADSAAEGIFEQTTEQQEELASVRDEMESFSATMEEVAASSTEVANASSRARDNIQSSLESTKETQTVTDEVKHRSENLVDTVADLEDEMVEIEEVAAVISDIADRTNILALNANIEAARAGEAGEGFAVVAGEVKSLADETQSHTERIAERIDTIQDRATKTVNLVEQTHEDVIEADESMSETVSSLTEATEDVSEATDGITELSRASDDQADTVEAVAAALEDVNRGAEEISMVSETIVDVTEEQRAAADALDESLEHFDKK
ncbi:PAS domain-containing protein [Haloferax mediterranei ATCC 33500]|uniref:Chemotaxis protein n=1 Tax=Haloferax mediterranei (strain ATCC 33500 / DSM 1411 / JCM 8866 / NBRC 14739 / NCIMB 2177 / R-4) TaxID=523841 RepID=I3R8J0_HALMT|nr:methyl-accepting chemotaxis protein [Haloferax mediterranei]AFK20550.1 transducer protein htr15 [Haloferax mediterranei ATCC 33500]AHZ23907.1 chemotaxis protein [Haloferax mediterranei ATCC 33500]ELZ98332.1 transducer protein htr15 [Haloferax mediterranei ATCC 33500]MDX5986695.1 methyl-accepting chemotaxis protein [Haloferax mediterranei ATCC 33500]QCQ76022.1 PAS domain-containing protein [Haloferax mediterranei ATCC 33500]